MPCDCIKVDAQLYILNYWISQESVVKLWHCLETEVLGNRIACFIKS